MCEYVVPTRPAATDSPFGPVPPPARKSKTAQAKNKQMTQTNRPYPRHATSETQTRTEKQTYTTHFKTQRREVIGNNNVENNCLTPWRIALLLFPCPLGRPHHFSVLPCYPQPSDTPMFSLLGSFSLLILTRLEHHRHIYVLIHFCQFLCCTGIGCPSIPSHQYEDTYQTNITANVPQDNTNTKMDNIETKDEETKETDSAPVTLPSAPRNIIFKTVASLPPLPDPSTMPEEEIEEIDEIEPENDDDMPLWLSQSGIAHRIHPFDIYLGGWDSAHSLKWLQENAITHILTVACGIEPAFPSKLYTVIGMYIHALVVRY